MADSAGHLVDEILPAPLPFCVTSLTVSIGQNLDSRDKSPNF